MRKQLMTSVFLAGLAGICFGSMPAVAEEVPPASGDKLAGVPDKKAEAAPEAASSQEVVIKGVQRLRVKTEKPEPDVKFDVDEIAVPYVKTEDSILDISPTAMADPAVSVPGMLNSTQAAQPYIQLFKRQPILTLNPRYNSQVAIAKWRLRITDGFGNVFRDFSGEGSLPQKIVWDGRNKDNSQMLDVGTSYSYIFSIIDIASNPTSQMGKPIVLESLMYEEGGGLNGQVVSDALFAKSERKTEVSKKGKLYLKEISDLLMQRQNYPLGIEVYAKDIGDAKDRGDLLQDYLAEQMTLPAEKFKVDPRKSRIEKVVFRIK